MASAGARAARNRETRQRLDAALARIGKRLDIAIPPEPRRAKDPFLQPIVELERFADFAEAVDAALAGHASEGEAPGGYDALTIAMLHDELGRRGRKAPSGVRSKAELIAFLESDDRGELETDDEEDEDETP